MSAVRIAKAAWQTMLDHARAEYPNECCGAMLGEGGEVSVAVPLENSFEGSRRTRYEIRPEHLLAATLQARAQGLRLTGIYHSHPDRDAFFSETDLKNCWPDHSFLVLSVRNGVFDHATCWRPNAGQTAAAREEIVLPL
jgi:proteasome lid subunit RPN8/RPN11